MKTRSPSSTEITLLYCCSTSRPDTRSLTPQRRHAPPASWPAVASAPHLWRWLCSSWLASCRKTRPPIGCAPRCWGWEVSAPASAGWSSSSSAPAPLALHGSHRGWGAARGLAPPAPCAQPKLILNNRLINTAGSLPENLGPRRQTHDFVTLQEQIRILRGLLSEKSSPQQ